MISLMISPLLPLLALSAAAAQVEPISNQPTNTQCEVALQVVRDLASHDYGKALIFDSTDPRPTGLDAAALTEGWTTADAGATTEADPPSRQLVDDFVSDVHNSIPRCSSVRRWLAKHRLRYGRAAVKAVVAHAVDDELPAGILVVSLSSVSSDAQTALVYTSDTWGGEAAGGFVRLYRRQRDGSWKSVSVRRLWIS